MLTNVIGINPSNISVQTDNYSVQRCLLDRFQSLSVLFTPTTENVSKTVREMTNRLGFDLVLDYLGSELTNPSQSDASRKRDCIQALAVMGIWASTCKNMQLDPPELLLM